MPLKRDSEEVVAIGSKLEVQCSCLQKEGGRSVGSVPGNVGLPSPYG
jgi:hypothetical protein